MLLEISPALSDSTVVLLAIAILANAGTEPANFEWSGLHTCMHLSILSQKGARGSRAMHAQLRGAGPGGMLPCFWWLLTTMDVVTTPTQTTPTHMPYNYLVEKPALL